MTEAEKLYYNNLMNNRNLNTYVFDKLFIVVDNKVQAKPNMGFKLMQNNIPYVFNAFDDDKIFKDLMPNKNQNLNDISFKLDSELNNKSFNSLPHQKFKLDWSDYNGEDIGNTFLPNSKVIKIKNLDIRDGKFFFDGLKIKETPIYFNGIEEEIYFRIYTYPKDSLISKNLKKFNSSDNEILLFFEDFENNQIKTSIILSKKISSKIFENYKITVKESEIILKNDFFKFLNNGISQSIFISILELYLKIDLNDIINLQKSFSNLSFYETDGHYSTIYLICLMLGMEDEKALELAIATENPDTDIHSETDFELDQTWSYPNEQTNIHALTGGFHGEEEFFTAVKILWINKENVKEIGELLHRFGDTYAHSKLNNLKPSDLTSYDLKNNPENEKKVIESWKGQKGEKLQEKITPWVIFLNSYIKEYGLSFFTDEEIQRKIFYGKTFSEILREIYLLKETDKFLMYGDKVPVINYGTTDHFATDGGYPDLIYLRPEWYLTYVNNLVWLLSLKYSLDSNKFNSSTFDKMITFIKIEECSMKGIIDYEIAKLRGKKVLYIPVFYSSPTRIFASFDAFLNSDYYISALNTLKFTKKYILQDEKTIIKEETVRNNDVKVNLSSGFFNTIAFKIIFQ